jgi:hypothetical protein
MRPQKAVAMLCVTLGLENTLSLMTNHQRIGAISNAHAGREFEALANAHYLGVEQWKLQKNFPVSVGFGERRKIHRFDLGCEDPPILIECKSHNFTATGNMPSAKMTVWNEAMYYFHLAPATYRKVLFVLEAVHQRQKQTLASCYVRNYGHLIPSGVEIVEFNTQTKILRSVPNEA